MVKDFEYVVVVIDNSMDYGAQVERVLPLNLENEKEVIKEIKSLMKETADEGIFEEYLSSVDNIDSLIDIYESLRADCVWIEGYSFAVKKLG